MDRELIIAIYLASNKFELPELKKTPKKNLKPWTAPPKNEKIDPEALKKELIESVKKREIK